MAKVFVRFLTYNSLEGLKEGLNKGEVSFPVFMKPVSGSGSVGIDKVNNWEEAVIKFNDGKFTYIIQEMMTGGDCNADVYVDCISHKPVAIFGKKKIESRMGGANKTISFRDQKLFDFVEEVCAVFELNGPCDMDFSLRMASITSQKSIRVLVVLICMLIAVVLISLSLSLTICMV